MTNDEKKKHLQDLALAVYTAHSALVKIENIATRAGLHCGNRQNMWFEGARNKVISVLINGEKA